MNIDQLNFIIKENKKKVIDVFSSVNRDQKITVIEASSPDDLIDKFKDFDKQCPGKYQLQLRSSIKERNTNPILIDYSTNKNNQVEGPKEEKSVLDYISMSDFHKHLDDHGKKIRKEIHDEHIQREKDRSLKDRELDIKKREEQLEGAGGKLLIILEFAANQAMKKYGPVIQGMMGGMNVGASQENDYHTANLNGEQKVSEMTEEQKVDEALLKLAQVGVTADILLDFANTVNKHPKLVSFLPKLKEMAPLVA